MTSSGEGNRAAVLVLGPEDFRQPPRTTTADGRVRNVGVEVEFAGLSAEEAARALSAELGGQIRERDPHAFELEGCTIGNISVELDTRYAHPESARTVLGAVGATLAPFIGSAVGHLVPCELIAAVPVDRLHRIDEAVAVLRRAGAKGTQDSAMYAFGLHFNPELPSLDAHTVAAYLKAFVIMNPWLRREAAPDSTRSFLGFADPFPDAYVRQIVAPSYWPDLAMLANDYLAHNPTRNRDLDALPLLAYVCEEPVRAVLPNEKIRSRPTLHYRLPDARVSDPGWSIAPDWNRWVVVERLAADRPRLDALGEAFLAFEGETKSWVDISERVAFA